MGLVMNKATDYCGYFDSFGHRFKWLEDTFKIHCKHVHKTKHVVQAENTATCGLHTIYFIIRLMEPGSKSPTNENVDIGECVRKHYDTKSTNARVKDKHVVEHLSKKFCTNFSMLPKH